MSLEDFSSDYCIWGPNLPLFDYYPLIKHRFHQAGDRGMKLWRPTSSLCSIHLRLCKLCSVCLLFHLYILSHVMKTVDLHAKLFSSGLNRPSFSFALLYPGCADCRRPVRGRTGRCCISAAKWKKQLKLGSESGSQRLIIAGKITPFIILM